MADPNQRLYDRLRSGRGTPQQEENPEEDPRAAARAQRAAAAAQDRERQAAAARAYREANARVSAEVEASRASRRSPETNDMLEAYRTNTPVNVVRARREAAGSNLRDESSSFLDMNNPRGQNSLSARGRSNEASSFLEDNNPKGSGGNIPAEEMTRRIERSLGNLSSATAPASSRAVTENRNIQPAAGSPSPSLTATPPPPSRSSIEDAARRTMTDPNYSDTANQAGRMRADEVSRQLEANTARRKLAAGRPTTRMSSSAARGNEMSADDLNAMVLDRLGKSYEGQRPPSGASADEARERISSRMSEGMKKGGPVKKMAKGGAVKASTKGMKPVYKMAGGGAARGDGCAARGKTKGRMV